MNGEPWPGVASTRPGQSTTASVNWRGHRDDADWGNRVPSQGATCVTYSEAYSTLGGGVAGLLAIAVMVLWSALLLSVNARLKDCKDSNGDLKTENKDLLAKITPLTTAVERQTAVIEAMNRELERRRVGR